MTDKLSCIVTVQISLFPVRAEHLQIHFHVDLVTTVIMQSNHMQ